MLSERPYGKKCPLPEPARHIVKWTLVPPMCKPALKSPSSPKSQKHPRPKASGDVFSLGCTVHALLSGRPPRRQGTQMAGSSSKVPGSSQSSEPVCQCMTQGMCGLALSSSCASPGLRRFEQFRAPKGAVFHAFNAPLRSSGRARSRSPRAAS